MINDMKQLIIAECKRIIVLLEHDAERHKYGYVDYPSSELFSKLHELRRDTITFEKLSRRKQ